MARLPAVPDSGPRILEHLSSNRILDALNDLLDGAGMVGIGLVVTEARHAPPALLVDITLDDAAGEGIAQALELVPLVLGQIQLGVVGVVLIVAVAGAVAEPDEQAGGGHALVVNVGLDVALCHVLLVGLDGGEVEHELEVDAVFVGWLPLEDVLVGAALVWGLAAGENEAVVAMGQRGQDLVEHFCDAVRELHVLHDKLEGLELELVGEAPEESVVGLVDVLLQVGEALVEGPLHQHHAVEDQAIEDEEGRHLGAVGLVVHDQLAVDDGVCVEGVVIVLARKMEVAVLDEVVVVLAVDEVHGLGIVLVLGQVQEVADAVGLFANIVAVIIKSQSASQSRLSWRGQ